ncbi:MAG: PilZ domain-containing protein [Candidatus Omnitrophota bacterium]
MAEQRKYMRFNVLMDAICRTGGMFKKLKINNFSKEGIGIIGKHSFKQGESLELEMTIPGDNVPVVLEGEVAWASDPVSDSSQYKGGIKFKKISNDDKSRILEYIYQEWIMPDKDTTK